MTARRGFTLLELMVVLVLLAITAAAAVPAFLGNTNATAERRVATALGDALAQARGVARETGAPATFVLSPADGRYWLAAGDSVTTGVLPLARDGVRLAIDGGERQQCRFEPAGPATSCAITVRGGRELTVRVDAWSGEIRVDNDRAR